jgi:fatty acid desaturase
MSHDEPMTLYPQASYVRALRPSLDPTMFAPARSRIARIPLHLAIITMSTLAIALGWVPWPVAALLSLVIGLSFAGLAFIAHEALHGGIVRGKRAKHIVGWIGWLPFVLSPRLWVAWHDQIHHANVNQVGEDPDLYPMLDEYNANRRIRFFINWFSLGGRRWRGALSLIMGFTVQSAHQLIVAHKRGFLSRKQHWFALGETALGIAVWATIAALIGFVPFVFAFVVPIVVANVIIMSFILTNHCLSPLTSINDPLASGLSVRNPRWIEWITMGFGYHVEHHLFPAMSSRHAPAVRTLLVARWPERYKSMVHWRAVRELHRTARVYKDAMTLIDPRTGYEYPTLSPGRATEPTLEAA